MNPQQESRMRVACLQMQPRIGQVQANVARSLGLIAQAARAGARLAVLPELCNTGYVFETREEALTLSEEVPDGPTCDAWMAAARTHSMFIVAGITEREGGHLYNSAVLIGPEGHIGTYRKNHLWGKENVIFQPGNLPMMANILAMGGAHANSMFVAAADRIGVERGQPFLGNSVIVSHTGWPLAGPASLDREEMLIADIDLADARRNRNLTDFNERLRDRRTDMYGEMLGSTAIPGY
jgi:predicted amidohydrolase